VLPACIDCDRGDRPACISGLTPADLLARPIRVAFWRPGEEAGIEAGTLQSGLEPTESFRREGDMRLLAGERHQDPKHHVIGARAEETGAISRAPGSDAARFHCADGGYRRPGWWWCARRSRSGNGAMRAPVTTFERRTSHQYPYEHALSRNPIAQESCLRADPGGH
jgi:hypothetical protein